MLVGLLATGCGGGSSSSGQLSKSAWIAKADGICRHYADETDISAHPQSFSDVAKLADHEEKAISKAHRDLRALGLPSQDRRAVRDWLRQFTQIELDLKDMRDSAKASDAGGVKAASRRGTSDISSARQAAENLGMKDCSD
jgi:hypothetical protein